MAHCEIQFRSGPRKNGIYATSRECLVEKGKVKGNGYASWSSGKWSQYGGWGQHYECSDFIWRAGGPAT